MDFSLIDDLDESAIAHDVNRIYSKLKEIVPEYKCNHTRQDVKTKAPVVSSHDERVPTYSS